MDKCNKIIEVDSFSLSGSIITACSIIDGEDKDWSINKDEFEIWADNNDLRQWERYSYNYAKDDFDESNGSFEWHEIYDGHEIMCDFLRQYVAHLYIMEAMDIETPIKNISQKHSKTA